ncbi:putative glutamate carboxypeptidase 2 [Nymphaea thermarum]|nr:putative glutamate carboxypeptidase 2 [Nymphaea thermarum]
MALSVQLPSHKSTTKISPPAFSLTLVLILFLSLLGYYTLHKTQTTMAAHHFHTTFIEASNNDTISSYLRSLTLHPHVAGTPNALRTRQYVLEQLTQLGFDTRVVKYQPLLSYPSYRSLSVHFPDGTCQSLPLDELRSGEVIEPYHAYSPSGNAAGKVVYVNYGRREDYSKLREMGVNVSGCVVIARNGGLFRGKVVEIAAAEGAAGVLLYTGRERYGMKNKSMEDDGSVGKFFPMDGIERGTVMRGLGDPLTPGWGGVEGGERLGLRDKEVMERFPKIPSLPISFDNARTILKALEGLEVPFEWRDGALEMGVLKVGSGPVAVNLTYASFIFQENRTIAEIGNVFAVIQGSMEPDRYVLLGNHRDAWTYGAVDPNSGTAALLDIARRFKILLNRGWKPRRTIILCSWDAEEFGMIGSTEWVEENLHILESKAVAYLNVDCAVQGPYFFAGATPQLDNLIVEITKQVSDPDSDYETVYQSWNASDGGFKIGRLSGVASDFAAFLQHGGIPSVDLYYGKGCTSSITSCIEVSKAEITYISAAGRCSLKIFTLVCADYPVYHTAYDSYEWIKKFGDPVFLRHVAVSGIWGLLALRLADDPVLPFDYLSYASQLEKHTKALEEIVARNVSLDPITGAVKELTAAASIASVEAKELLMLPVNVACDLQRRSINDRLMLTERGFLDDEGLRGRKWFKHLIYGPSRDGESKLDFFPGIVDAVAESRMMSKEGGHKLVQHEVWRVSRAILRAAHVLRGDLT